MIDYDDFLDQIKDITGYKLFCHYTNNDAESILEEGLGLYDSDWYTTLLELSIEEIENLDDFFQEQISNSSRMRPTKSAILVAVPYECGYNFVSKNSKVNKVTYDMDYIIEPGFIVCSIELHEKTVTINENSYAMSDFMTL